MRLPLHKRIVPMEFIAYLSSILIAALVPVCLSVIIAKILSVQEFGIWILFVSSYGFLRPLLTVGLADALKSCFSKSDRKSALRQLIFGCLISLLMLVVTLIIVLLVHILGVEFKSPYSDSFVYFALLVAATEGILAQQMVFIQFSLGAKRYLLHTLASSVLILFFSFLGLYFTYSWKGVAGGRVAAYLLSILLVLYFLSKQNIFESINLSSISKFNEVRKLLIQGCEHLPFDLRLVGIPFICRYSLSWGASLEYVANFGVASLFGSSILLISMGIILYVQPILTSSYKNLDKEFLTKLITYSVFFFFSLVGSVVLISFLSPILIQKLFGPRYVSTHSLINSTLILFLLLGTFDFAQMLLQSIGKSRIASITNIVLITLIGLYVGIWHHFSSVEEILFIIGTLIAVLVLVSMWIIRLNLKYLIIRHANLES